MEAVEVGSPVRKMSGYLCRLFFHCEVRRGKVRVSLCGSVANRMFFGPLGFTCSTEKFSQGV